MATRQRSRGQSAARRRARTQDRRRATRPAAPRRVVVQPRRAGSMAALPLVGLALAGVVGLALAWVTRAGPPPAGSIATPLPLSSYTITYRVTNAGAATQIDKRVVQRPFGGKQETISSSGVVQTGTLTTASAAYLYLNQPQPGWVKAEDGSHRAAGDERAGAALQWALRNGLARVVGRRMILGRSCSVVETGGPVGMPVKAPTEAEHADLCVDRYGVVLREDWTLNGRPARTRVAVAYQPGAAVPDSDLVPRPLGPPLPPGATSTTVRTLSPDQIRSLPVTMTPPPGYVLGGAQVEATTGSGVAPTVVDIAHYVDGPELIDLDVGNVRPPAGAIAVTVGSRQAQLALDLTASDLYLTVGDATVRLEGPDPALLIAAARTLSHS
ncbi:MAG TPA: hypothetical protein VFH45_11945 [Acidimicrobiales bacterium]|nr:hypothetical protein [Acidimicrobiales bacterium]